MYRSKDHGNTWEDISDGIPGGPVNVILEDPENKDILFVGTDMGVYVSTDGAKTWNVLGVDLPITFVHDLAIQPRDKVLVAATHGRGMYTLPLSIMYAAASDKDPDDEDKEGNGDGTESGDDN